MKRKINWMNLGFVVAIVLEIIILISTPSLIKYAQEYRAQFNIVNAFGSEYFLWILPMIYIMLYLEFRKD